MQPEILKDERIYTNFKQLVKFKYLPSLFSLSPYDNGGGLMSGRHLSKFRGRGLNFEEFRHYHEGDDIRAMDWRVTLRSRKPHVRVYSEEKELPVIVILDQRKSMFFSSQEVMKSVVASQLAALSVWQVLKESDRIGCLIFNDQSQQYFAPQRGMAHALRIMQCINDYNQQLSAETMVSKSSNESLQQSLVNVQKRNFKGALIMMLTDFNGFDELSKKQLQTLQQDNDVLAIAIKDPLEEKLNQALSFYATDGLKQVNLTQPSPRLIERYQQHNHRQQKKIKHTFAGRLTPFIEVGTNGEHLIEMQKAILRRA